MRIALLYDDLSSRPHPAEDELSILDSLDAVDDAVCALGHTPVWIPVPPRVDSWIELLAHSSIDVVFNLYEGIGVDSANEVRVAGIPGGGGTMTAADLALFYQALLDGGRALAGRELWKPETLAFAREIRSGELRDPLLRKHANRGLGVIISGDADRTFRGFGHTNSELAFGHGGAGGQIAWADPATGISIGYCTNGHDRHAIRQGRRGVGISSRAAGCARA